MLKLLIFILKTLFYFNLKVFPSYFYFLQTINLIIFSISYFSGDAYTNIYSPIGNPCFRSPKFKEMDVYSGDRWGILLIILAVSIGKEINSKKALKMLKGKEKELAKGVREMMELSKEFEAFFEEFMEKGHDE